MADSHLSASITVTRSSTGRNTNEYSSRKVACDVKRVRSDSISLNSVQVLVGRLGETRGFFSSEEELRQIPYFADLFDCTEEAKHGQITLTDYPPGAFKQVLYFASKGELEYDLAKLCEHSGEGKVFHPLSTEMVQTYYLAKEFGLEACMNDASDSIRSALRYIKLSAADMIEILQDNAGDIEDPLNRMASQAIAVEINAAGYDQWHEQNENWFQEFVNVEPIAEVLLQMAMIKYSDAVNPALAPPVGEMRCKWHRHSITPPCRIAKAPPLPPRAEGCGTELETTQAAETTETVAETSKPDPEDKDATLPISLAASVSEHSDDSNSDSNGLVTPAASIAGTTTPPSALTPSSDLSPSPSPNQDDSEIVCMKPKEGIEGESESKVEEEPVVECLAEAVTKTETAAEGREGKPTVISNESDKGEDLTHEDSAGSSKWAEFLSV
jgi:hypothetical protein